MRTRLPDWPLLRTTTFRLTIGSAAFLAAALLLQSALIFWQTTTYEITRTDQLLSREIALMAVRTKPALDQRLRMRASDDLHLLIIAAGLFDANRRVVGGNLPGWPKGLALDGRVHQILVHPTDQGPRLVRAQAARLPGGDILVMARGIRDLEELRAILRRSLALAALPSIMLAVLGGVWLSHRALLRFGVMHRAIERIMDGDLQERLPLAGRHGSGDDVDRLAGSVNRMLERLQHLLDEIKGVGDDIAHDLRTPLARVRTRLERARSTPDDPRALGNSIERAIIDLDKCFGIITALLRISEIENGRRRSAFAPLSLGEIVADIVDLYEPIAETREVALVTGRCDPADLHGDRDLLIELIANLIDNAIKFTPAGGRVEIGVLVVEAAATLRITDTGCGIPPVERDAVLGRFFRSDKSRHLEGSGLGLSLVAAIASLHGAALAIRDARPGGNPPGCLFEVVFATETRALPNPMPSSATVGSSAGPAAFSKI